jgi:hypothetical protein
MFFKTVDPAQAADAGAQLQNVIRFRESLIVGKAILFREFESTDAWEKMLRNCFYQHVLDIAHAPSAEPGGPSGRSPQPARSILTSADSPDAAAAGDQVAALARSLEPAFENGDLSEITGALNDEREAAFWAVRGVLLSAALVSASGTSATALPIHELNTLYRYRDRLRATSHELFVLFRSILADGFDAKPGWYWFRDYEVEEVEGRLISTALFGDDTEARAGSFEILRRAQVAIFARVRDQFLERSLREIPSNLRDAAWAYLVDTSTPEDLRLLREWTGGTWLESRVQWLQAWVETGRDLDHFLRKAPDPQLIPEPMKESIGASITRLSDESLRALQSMSVFYLSDVAAAELESRGSPISGYKPRPGARHRPGALPLASFGGLAMTGLEESDTDDEERYERLSRGNNDTLRGTLDWYKADGATSYRLLAERGEIARDVVRGDLLNGFRRVRDESYQQVERMIGPERAARNDQEFKDLHGS